MTDSEAHVTPVFKAKAEKVHSGVTTSSAGKFYIAALKKPVHICFAITGLDKCARGRC